MDLVREYIPTVILVVLGILFQAFFANAITIGNATPNFMVCFALIIVILRPTMGSVGVAFVMGLLYNLMNGGPVGAMAFVLTLLGFALYLFFNRMDGTNLLVALFSLLVLGFLSEVLYGLMVATFMSGISVSQALVQLALPCGVYDALVGCVLYPVPALLSKILSNRSQGGGSWTM